MNTWATHIPYTHPWFAKPSMKRKFLDSSSSSAASSSHASQAGSDSDSPPAVSAAAAAAHSGAGAHRAKRRKFAMLEHGLAHLSLDNLSASAVPRSAGTPTSSATASGFTTAYSVSPQSATSQLTNSYDGTELAPSITEMYDPYQTNPQGIGAPRLPPTFEEEVVRPAYVEEPEPPIPSSSTHDVRMKSAGWYELEPDRESSYSGPSSVHLTTSSSTRFDSSSHPHTDATPRTNPPSSSSSTAPRRPPSGIVITDLDDLSESETEPDTDGPSVMLPESVLRALSARAFEPAINPRLTAPSTSQALVLFRPLKIPPQPELDERELEEESNEGVEARVGLGGEPLDADVSMAPDPFRASGFEQGMVVEEDDDAMDVEP
ncbi:hypothetical protein HGRIS_002241 [Hohenbuehelia grisea]|uniref:Uncharacterized protein n=1 Tax=Hohenbuehelia grisea TaxID=104357 RepID=A0ABR3JL40_9AGAR